MPLTSMKKILQKASKEGYAVGSFNAFNLESVQAVISAAEELNSPAIIAVTPSAAKYAGMQNLASIILPMIKNSKAGIALHLDHGKTVQDCAEALKFGFNSVMIDASSFSLKENISVTKKVVLLARKKKAAVEAELGMLGKIGEGIALTDPIQAREFVQKTKVGSLAVAVGTSHGAYKFEGNPKIDLERIKEIKKETNIPLVLHGASSVPQELIEKAQKYGAAFENAIGVPEETIKKAISFGIAKINIDTDLRLAFAASIREFLAENPKEFDPRKILSPAREAVKEQVKQKIKLFGSESKV